MDKPAKRLIKGICYSDSVRFNTAAMIWGCEHEKDALEAYQKHMETTHDGFKMETSRFVISDNFPFIGASPNSMVESNCCGKGTVEVKCPYCVRDKLVEEKVAWLENVEGRTQLCRTHQYYYQVQTQVFVCNVDYSDFVAWTKEGIHQERISPDIREIHSILQTCCVTRNSGEIFLWTPPVNFSCHSCSIDKQVNVSE